MDPEFELEEVVVDSFCPVYPRSKPRLAVSKPRPFALPFQTLACGAVIDKGRYCLISQTEEAPIFQVDFKESRSGGVKPFLHDKACKVRGLGVWRQLVVLVFWQDELRVYLDERLVPLKLVNGRPHHGFYECPFIQPIVVIGEHFYFPARFTDATDKIAHGTMRVPMPSLHAAAQACMASGVPAEFDLRPFGMPKVKYFWQNTFMKDWMYVIENHGVLKKLRFDDPHYTVKRSTGDSFLIGTRSLTAVDEDRVVATGLQLGDYLEDAFQLYVQMRAVHHLRVRLPQSTAALVGRSIVNKSPFIGTVHLRSRVFVYSFVESAALTLVQVVDSQLRLVQVVDLLALGVAKQKLRLVDVHLENKTRLRCFLADCSAFTVTFRA